MGKLFSPPNKSKTSNNQKIFFFIAIALFLIAFLIYFTHLDFIVITKIKNGEFFSGKYRFKEEDFFHPRLQLLRKHEKLDKVISSGKTQFEKIVLLRRWTKQQWDKTTENFYYPPWDAIEILNLGRKYDNWGFCAQYAIVFLQACLSVGIHARYVDLIGHFLVEVWSDDYNKWVVMDPSNNIHYERNDIPLNGCELSTAYWKDKVKDTYKVNSRSIKTRIKKADLFLYRVYSIVRKNNHLSEPEDIIVNGVRKKLLINPNYKTYPSINVDNLAFLETFLAFKADYQTEFFEGKDFSDDPADFRYVKNQTMISFAGRYDNMAEIKLIAENSPTFKAFLVNIDDAGWNAITGTIFPWALRPGFNKLSARIITKFGWEGCESYIKVFYKPSWLFKY